MTREEVQKFLAMVQGVYPNYNPHDKTATINAWTIAMEEYNENEVALAFTTYMKTNTSGFAPSPGQIINLIYEISTPQELNEMEAWSLVSKAIRNGYYGAEEEFAKLPTLIQQAIGMPSQLRQWAQTDSESIENVVQSNFLRTYRTVLARNKELVKMPQNVKQLIEKVNQNSYKAQIEQKRVNSIKSSTESGKIKICASESTRKGNGIPERVRDKWEKMKNDAN